MSDPTNKILTTMLERLYASLLTGPVLSCRPHSSRQRIDLTLLEKLEGKRSGEILSDLLGDDGEVKLLASATKPSERASTAEIDALSASDRASRQAWDDQQALLRKLRVIADDARIYEHDTGAQVLYVGYPILHLPPQHGLGNKRILAPISFVPIQLTIRATRPFTVTLSCAHEGADRVIPNEALLAWIERQTGHHFDETFQDDEGTDPWREINDLVMRVKSALNIPDSAQLNSTDVIHAAPRSDGDESSQPSVLSSAVLGLFPVSNQGLLRDLQALVDGEPTEGPLEGFLRANSSFSKREIVDANARNAIPERLVAIADPCQARAVRLARKSSGLVIHGPPGTGKSQTIANIIGDHLARGERVLFVCDKRTALDVVHHRLTHLGLETLCAVVHDAQKDQRDLYLGIRAQLDDLADTKSDASAVSDLDLVDREMGDLHRQLTAHMRALTQRPSNGSEPSLSELSGDWMAIEVDPKLNVPRTVSNVPLADLVSLERECGEILERARNGDFSNNPWTAALGISLPDFLKRSMERWRVDIDEAVQRAQNVDARLGNHVIAFDQSIAIDDQAKAREALGNRLNELFARCDHAALARWTSISGTAIAEAESTLSALEPHRETLAKAKPDPELAIVFKAESVSAVQLATWIAIMNAYRAIAQKWYRFFCFGRKREALSVLRRFGLALGAAAAERLGRHFAANRARELLLEWHRGAPDPARNLDLSTDDSLVRSAEMHAAIFALLRDLSLEPALRPIANSIRLQLAEVDQHATLVEGLLKAPARAESIALLESHLHSIGLFSAKWRREIVDLCRAGQPIAPVFSSLQQRVSTVEGVLRVQQGLSQMRESVAAALEPLIDRSANGKDGWSAIRKAVIADHIQRRIDENPVLTELDGDALRARHGHYRELESARRDNTRRIIVDSWNARARSRLLASTGSRLNGLGADLRRRLTLRGERAMRVRQVIAAGRAIAGGDPLFDVRPVWMASPETVAQIFPRVPLFDVVIFDEASQCRLEEALPVLLRAKRMVIAGDPQQLPPTRFFESSIAQSQETDSDETEQGLFEEQQSDVEDLLGAALNIEIEQAYLDVHYRSQNAELIAFSNQHFYDARLQPIPAHPSRRARNPAVRLVAVPGVYDKRENKIEALAVVKLVKELLSSESPPSIGIACFNLVQRDTISEALDEAALADPDFGGRLALARMRKGQASFEGLFVKNLENVQGDERDHMIISTTYGPDPKGKFHRRFGPLALAGGGRRLNVLITRARCEVHLVTSIPVSVYSNLPPIEPGKNPNGAWLLFSYLMYADSLARGYAMAAKESMNPSNLAENDATLMVINETRHPSALARSVASHLAHTHKIGSIVHWGNDGFCVDVALYRTGLPDQVTLGVLCDGTRYQNAEDPIEWELFRVAILESQGWKLHRIWTPQLFRDPDGCLRAIRIASESAAADVRAHESPTVETTPPAMSN